MTPKTVEPALTDTEWEHLRQFPEQYEGSGIYIERTEGPECGAVVVEYTYVTTQRHALAALCLYGQPFGFTHGELAHLSHAIDDAERWIANHPFYGHDGAVEASRVVLAKLRALLPPPPSV